MNFAKKARKVNTFCLGHCDGRNETGVTPGAHTSQSASDNGGAVVSPLRQIVHFDLGQSGHGRQSVISSHRRSIALYARGLCPKPPLTGPQSQGPPSPSPLNTRTDLVDRDCTSANASVHFSRMRGMVEGESRSSVARRPRGRGRCSETPLQTLVGSRVWKLERYLTNSRVCSTHWRTRQTLRLMAKWVTFQFHRWQGRSHRRSS